MATASSVVVPCTVTGVPAVPWRSALDSRLDTACATRAASQGDRPVKGQVEQNVVLRRGGADFVDDLGESLAKRRVGGRVDANAAAEPGLGVEHDVLDQIIHAKDGRAHQRQQHLRLVCQRFLAQHPQPGVERGHRVAQVVAKHGDEFFLNARQLPLMGHQLFLRFQPFFGFEAAADGVGEHLQHGDDAGDA